VTLPPRGDDPPIPAAPPAGGNIAAIETSGLAKRYRRVTALRDCTISVPAGRISALVGPNGAGKTTLLRLLTGLAAPTGGRATVLGATPRQDPGYLAGIGFLAQEIPLYRRLTAQDHIGIGAHLNPRWDGESVRARLAGLRIPLDQRVGTLSGGQRAQVALALTLAKRPRVLLLDEPLAALDPLARQTFLAALAEAAAVQGDELTIVLSSHLIADIERVCDHLILLADSRVQLCGDIDTLLAGHRVLVGPRKDTTAIARAHTIVREDSTERQTTLLIRLNGPVLDPAWAVEETNLEEMVLGYMTQGAAGSAAGPAAGRLSAVGGDR
jgi:ABC-2 type transport system ATP-binding protein